jgi:DNA-binding NarL/FixJ family response regulator
VTKLVSFMLKLRPGRHPARRGVPIVVAGAGPLERETLSEALKNFGKQEPWALEFTNVCEEAWHVANQLRAPVILCARDLPETDWREAVGTLSALPHRPVVILLSKVADEPLWSEVFRIGGFEILAKPMRADDIRRVINLALSYWQSEAAAANKKSG